MSTNNLKLIATAYAAIAKIEGVETSEGVDELANNAKSLAKARETLANMGLPTDAVDAQLEALEKQIAEADGERTEVLAQLQQLGRAVKIAANTASAKPKPMFRDIYARWNDKAPPLPEAVQMQDITTDSGKTVQRAVHGQREPQIAQAFAHFCNGGKSRVSVEVLAVTLCEIDESFGTVENAEASVRATLGRFADMFTSKGSFTLVR